MIELKKEFTKGLGKTKHFKQIHKDKEGLVIYEVSLLSANNLPPTKFYEVFRYSLKGKDFIFNDEHEVYPSLENFGSWAWSCSNPSCVAKVLTLHFPTHPLTKKMLKYTDGTYKRNGETLPHFNLTEDELISEIAGLE